MAHLIENYLFEIKQELVKFTQDCREYNLPYNSIKNTLELLICIDKDPNIQKEVFDILFIQIPELLHIRNAITFIENISQLFSGSLATLLIEYEDQFIYLSKNILKEEMKRLEVYRDNYDECQINDIDLEKEMRNFSL